MKRKVTTTVLDRMKQNGERIAMITAYDATFARLLDQAGADVLLVGDSLGMVIQGSDDTLGVTMDDMVYHCRAVARGAERALVVGDMPFLSFQVSPEDALRNAGRLLSEGRAQAVKVEGGRTVAPVVERLVQAGIPVMGHIGLTPQSVHQLGGFKVQGRGKDAARALMDDALALQAAGCFALVLELVPGELAERISRRLHIPTIGIGAGVGCDGQVLVCYDLLGMNEGFRPKFLKTYANLAESVQAAAGTYVDEVRRGLFPGAEHTFDDPSLAASEPSAPVALYGGASAEPTTLARGLAQSEPAAAVG